MAHEMKRNGNTRAHAEWLRFTMTLLVERMTLAVLAAFLGLSLFVYLAYRVNRVSTQRFDAGVIAFCQEHQPPLLRMMMNGVTLLGGFYVIFGVITLAVIGFTVARRLWPEGISMMIAGGGGWVLLTGLKTAFERPRPDPAYEVLGYSFPSGHAFFSVTVYGMLAYQLTRNASPRRRRWMWGITLPMILLVGSSRVLLGVHYPSDVAAGFAAALPWLWGCLALPNALERLRSRRAGSKLSPSEARNPERSAGAGER